ncbi:glycosyltransferase family 2 protein [Cohnella luojiensis]|uniref:Glycosyltransferase n=1 Tax=Cohnella luojiensis TaxID=652876 RepID=A0A4Y8LQG0_9BACL|nr:glycosyltransferase [Cohnella luojiensis]TFE22643.1 glycosyltransferase [Cohnella luojiensis]
MNATRLGYHFTVCICTRNRPDDLSNALRSLERSKVKIHEIIVSDDSTDIRTEQLVKSNFPNVHYLPGPKIGLSANRNHAIRAATGTHLLFIDDDVKMVNDFFVKISEVLRRNDRVYGNKVIITGLENKNGSIIYPHNQTFLGFQSRPYKDEEPLKTIVINSTVFPITLFKEILFDEQLIYGYEEVDIATRAVQKGYSILLSKETINYHYPSEINRDFYKSYITTSRIYATFKRYLFTERKWFKALSFFIVALIHTILHGIKVEGSKGFLSSLRTISNSINYILIDMKKKRSHKTNIN